MAASAQDIILKANVLLQDLDNTRWSQSELLMWLNEAQLAIINLLPCGLSLFLAFLHFGIQDLTRVSRKW